MRNSVVDRLNSYGEFDSVVVDRVAEVAEEQQLYDAAGFLARYGITELTTIAAPGAKPVEIADILPLDRDSADDKHARVLHIAMANPLDGNQLYQAATFIAADPTARTIVIGNPSSGNNRGRLSLRDARKVAAGDWGPTVAPLLHYLKQEGIKKIENIGYSLGALKAQVASEEAEKYDMEATTTVAIEPANVKKRNPLKLLADFAATGKPLKGYVEASDTPAFIEARGGSDSIFGLARYMGGILFRTSNLAVGYGLCKPTYEEHADSALANNPEMKSVTVWGSESELAIDGLTAAIVERLAAKHGAHRVFGKRLEGQKHNMVNDIHLQAAIVHDSLRRAA